MEVDTVTTTTSHACVPSVGPANISAAPAVSSPCAVQNASSVPLMSPSPPPAETVTETAKPNDPALIGSTDNPNVATVSTPTATTAPTAKKESAPVSTEEDEDQAQPRQFVINDIATYTYASNDPSEDTMFVSSDKNILAVFDGHGGREIAEYLASNIEPTYRDVRAQAEDAQGALVKTFAKLEDHILAQAMKGKNVEMGSCGVVVVIDRDTQPHVTVANVGDSKAVLGCKFNGRSQHISLSTEHNVRITTEASALQLAFPDEPDVVSYADGDLSTPRVKGTLQLTRCFGDAFLKQPEHFPADFDSSPAGRPKKKRRTSGRKSGSSAAHPPYITAEPSIDTDELEDVDFIIVASDGLWDHINEDMAVHLVYEYLEKGGKREDVSKYLVERTLERVAFTTFGGLTVQGLKDLPLGTRRYHHDDTTIIVAFIDNVKTGETTV